MKRTPLRRKTPLRRTAIKRKARRVPHVTLEDKARLEWLHEQPCATPGHRDCGPVDVHHNTQNRARGKKSGHDQGIPMCHQSHMDFHANTGGFKGWTKDMLRNWQTGQVMMWQASWDLERRRRDTIDREGNVTP